MYKPNTDLNIPPPYGKTRQRYVPSVDEIRSLDEMIFLADQDIRECDIRIAGLQDILQQLMFTRDALKIRRDAWTALKSPIRHVPTEVLREIFEHSVLGEDIEIGRSTAPSQRGSKPVQHKVTIGTLLHIGRVCKFWRETCLTTGSLWSKFILHVSHFLPSGLSEVDASVLETLLERSCGQGLQFEIQAPSHFGRLYGRDHAAIARYEAVVDRLLPHAERWADVKLALADGIARRLAGQEDFSGLRKFTMTNLEHSVSLPALRIFQSAKNLRTLSLFSLPSTPLELPLDGVKELHFVVRDFNHQLDQAHRLLRGCISLDKLHVESQSIWPTWLNEEESLSPPENHPRMYPPTVHLISELSIPMHDSESAAFIDSLILPNLRHLTLDAGGSCVTGIPTDPLCNLAIRSDWSLQLLTIKNARLLSTRSTLQPILSCNPSLVVLDIFDDHDHSPSPYGMTLDPALELDAPQGGDSSTWLFDILTTSSEETILPHLSRLSIHCRWNDDRTRPEKIHKMIESRRFDARVSSLESFTFWSTADVPPDMMENLMSLRHLGVGVSVLVDVDLERQRQWQSKTWDGQE